MDSCGRSYLQERLPFFLGERGGSSFGGGAVAVFRTRLHPWFLGAKKGGSRCPTMVSHQAYVVLFSRLPVLPSVDPLVEVSSVDSK